MSREQFEQVLKEKFDNLIDYRVCSNGDGEYMAWDIQVAWFAWQSATNAMEAKCAALAAELKQSQIDASCYKKGMEASNERLVQLAAENAGLKAGAIKAIEDIQCFYDSEAWHVSEDGESETAVVALDDAKGSVEHFVLNVKTPDTDAFLAEVRAQGVEMLREHPAIKLCSLTHVCDEFAAQLRKGAQS